MASDTSDSGETDETDAKLDAERERADEELLERSTALGEDADAVLRRARERARTVLELARVREDRAIPPSGSDRSERARAQADMALQREHSSADAALDVERARRLRAVMHVLATERGDTDHALAAERDAFAKMLSARDDILAGVGHDIRGHLSILMLNGSSIALRSNDPKIIALADAMLRSTAQMDFLLADLLHAATLGTGELVIHPQPTDIVSLVLGAVELNDLAAKARSIQLAFDTSIPSAELHLDGPRITRVVMNLLSNAIKFSPDGGRVVVSVKPQASEVEVSVADTGPGIPAEQLEAIFRRFWKSDTSKAGYGLGLYIAQAIVDAHRGRIWAQNNEHQGATFSFRIPTHVHGQ